MAQAFGSAMEAFQCTEHPGCHTYCRRGWDGEYYYHHVRGSEMSVHPALIRLRRERAERIKSFYPQGLSQVLLDQIKTGTGILRTSWVPVAEVYGIMDGANATD